MRRAFVALALSAVCLLAASTVMAQVFSEFLGNQVWDEYITRYIRVAKEKGVAAATSRNEQIRDIIARQHAFASWPELNSQAVKDLGVEKWTEISKAKMAELKEKLQALQAESAEKAKGAAQEAAGAASEQAAGASEQASESTGEAKKSAGEAMKKLPDAAKKLPKLF